MKTSKAKHLRGNWRNIIYIRTFKVRHTDEEVLLEPPVHGPPPAVEDHHAVRNRVQRPEDWRHGWMDGMVSGLVVLS